MVIVFLGPDSFCSFSFIPFVYFVSTRRVPGPFGALDFYAYKKQRKKKRGYDMI